MAEAAAVAEAPENLPDVLAELLAYEREAFEEDTPIDLADLCTWFGQMRSRLSAAIIHGSLADMPVQIIREALGTGAGYLEEVRDDQTSGEDDGTYEPGPAIHARLDRDDALIGLALAALDGAPDATVLVPTYLLDSAAEYVERFADEASEPSEGDCRATLAGLRSVLKGQLLRRTIGIRIEGGLFAGAFAAQPMPDVTLTVFDFDDDCLEPDRAFKVAGEERWASVNSYDGADFDVKPVPAYEPVEDEDA